MENIECVNQMKEGQIGRICGIREKRNVFRYLVGTPEEKKPVWRLRRRWEVDITDLKGIDWKEVKWAYLVQHVDYWLTFMNSGTAFGLLGIRLAEQILSGQVASCRTELAGELILITGCQFDSFYNRPSKSISPSSHWEEARSCA